MVTTKPKSIVDTQKITKKESNHNTLESPQTKREESKKRRNRGTTTQPEKQLTKWL